MRTAQLSTSKRYRRRRGRRGQAAQNRRPGARPQIARDFRRRAALYRARPPADLDARRRRLRIRQRRDADRRRRQHLCRFLRRRRGRQPRPRTSRDGRGDFEAGRPPDGRDLRHARAGRGLQARSAKSRPPTSSAPIFIAAAPRPSKPRSGSRVPSPKKTKW